jgi:hypothetical protein
VPRGDDRFEMNGDLHLTGFASETCELLNHIE